MIIVDGYKNTTLAVLTKSEDGATMIEYALIAALVALVVIAGLSLIAPAIDSTLTNVTQSF
jgi:Flp pilus assembly pilin Flp